MAFRRQIFFDKIYTPEEEGPIMALRRQILLEIFFRAYADKVCKDIINNPNHPETNYPRDCYLFRSRRSITFKYIMRKLRENNIPFEVERVTSTIWLRRERNNTRNGKNIYSITIK